MGSYLLTAAKLVEEAPSLDDFRARWIVPRRRRELLEHLPEGERSAALVQQLDAINALPAALLRRAFSGQL